MWLAIDAVRGGQADAVVSAGNTGALMAMARFILKTLPGISRPAIAAMWPTLRSESVVLDVGATIGADAAQLVEFAVMGEAMARCLLGLEKPTVGLLNVGVEEIKGVEQVKEEGRRGDCKTVGHLSQALSVPNFAEPTGCVACCWCVSCSQGPYGSTQAQWRRFPWP
jgi:glycerol-3-phosphate acyltransferase PlsX